MASWFGSSGIRGPYGETLGPGLALRLGEIVGSRRPRLLVGHDARTTSPLLSEAFIAGALSVGADVSFAGPAATPSIAYAARGFDAAVTVTASHNPPTDNGFKFWNPNGSAWDPEAEAKVEEGLSSPTPPARCDWRRIRQRTATDATGLHRAAIRKFVRPQAGRVILDCGNGAGSFVSPALFREVGLAVESLNEAPDGRFPNRPSEPTPENLSQLMERCRRNNSWGIAHDGDADRMVPIDPSGQVVPSERVMVALALLLKARRIATPIDASLSLARALPGVDWTYTRVGDAAVSAALDQGKGDFGAETSGTYIVPAFDLAPDGPLAALLFLEAARQGLVQEADARLGPVVRRSQKLPLGTLDRAEARRRLTQVEAGPQERASRVDGVRVDTEDGWFLLRPSGTEPVLRVTAEATTTAAADRLLERGLDAARTALAAGAHR